MWIVFMCNIELEAKQNCTIAYYIYICFILKFLKFFKYVCKHDLDEIYLLLDANKKQSDYRNWNNILIIVRKIIK